MKHFRKILALLLVIATLLSISLTASAATVQYTDAKNINHEAAVDVLSALGVINGYANSSFKPASSVTRAEMAKILAFVLNGGEDVGEQYSAACTFADSVSHWAAGYIGYCVSAGLINGKNANTFDPDGKVTGYEAAKMLLCALGYKADLNGLTGSKWNTNTHSLAIKTKLLEELVDYVPANALNRDDTCQMILNTLKATMVETTGTTTAIGNLTITSDVVNTELVNTTSDYRGAGNVDGKLQLMEDVFPELKQQTGIANDVFGRPCTTWALKGTTLGSYPMKAIVNQDATSTGAKVYDIINDLPESVDVYIDGALISTANYTDLADLLASARSTLSASQKASLTAARDGFTSVYTQLRGVSYATLSAAMANISGTSTSGGRPYAAHSVLVQMWKQATETFRWWYLYQGSSSGMTMCPTGSHIEVYYDETTAKLTYCAGYYWYGQVTAMRGDVLDAEGNVVTPGYVTIQTATAPSGVSWDNLQLSDTVTIPCGGSTVSMPMSVINTEDGDVKVGGYIAYYAGINRDTGKHAILYGLPMQRATTKLTRTTTGNGRPYDANVRGDGIYYYRANGGTSGLHTAGDTYDIYYATIGNRNIMFYSEAAVGDYVYIYNAGEKTPAVVQTFQAKVVKSDGTVEILETDQNYRANVGSVAALSTNAAGQTVLSPVGEYSGNFNVRVAINNSNAIVTFDNVSKVAANSTRFVVGTIDTLGNETYTVYRGITKVPTITSARYYAYVEKDNVLDTVFLIDANGISSTEKEGMLIKTGKEIIRTDKSGSFYEMQAILSGKITTMNLSAAAYTNLGANGIHLFNNYTVDANEIVTAINRVTGTAITAFSPADAGIVTLNNAPMTYGDYVLVYTYSVSNNTLAISNVESLYTLNNTYPSYYTLHEYYPNKPLAGIFAVID